MKNLIFILVLAMGFSTMAIAQSGLGIKAGLNFANLAVDKDEIDDSNTKLGFTAGLFLDIPFMGEDFLYIRPEATYTAKGAKYKFGETEVKADLHYIDIPVLAVLRLFGSPVTIHAGPQFSYLARVSYEYDSPVFGESKVVDDNKDNYNTWDFGIVGGLGLDINNLVIEARVARGFQNVEEDKTILSQPVVANNTKNFGFLFTLGYRF